MAKKKKISKTENKLRNQRRYQITKRNKIRKNLAKQRVGNKVLNLDGITAKETERVMILLDRKDFKNVFRFCLIVSKSNSVIFRRSAILSYSF